jgi:hypothetical protein
VAWSLVDGARAFLTVLVPFVVPEVLVVSLLVQPVGVHIVEKVVVAGLGDDAGDVVGLAAGVAELRV